MESLRCSFGEGSLTAPFPDNWKGELLDSPYVQTKKPLGRIVRDALDSPIDSPRLSEIVTPGEKVCIVFSDITRSWQASGCYLPIIVQRLEESGIRADDITLLCALGTHRKHSDDELKCLTGSLFGQYNIIDHDCDDYNNLVHVGTTSRGTVVEVNRAAVDADRLILTGGLVFHLMAGYSAGRKAIVPGIASRKTIMQNHSLSLSPEEGGGSHPNIGCDCLEDNPLHLDLMEAQEFLKPDFIVNVLPGKTAPGAAVAGHYLSAYEAGCEKLRENFLVEVDEKRELVIASAGGFPGDINFYQSVKSMINAAQALEEGGTLILVTRSQEGLGNPLMEEMIGRFDTIQERESFVRNNYSIGRFIAYYACELASRFKVLLVTEMDEPSLEKADILSFSTLQEALDHTRAQTEGRELSCWIIPDSAHTFPKVRALKL